MTFTMDDFLQIIEVVGDSWPAAIVVVALVIGFIAWRALPRLRDIADVMKDLRHEMYPNSGKSLRDAVNRIERQGVETKNALDEHITSDREWKVQAEDLLTRVEHDGRDMTTGS
jgi:hypothetical protein